MKRSSAPGVPFAMRLALLFLTGCTAAVASAPPRITASATEPTGRTAASIAAFCAEWRVDLAREVELFEGLTPECAETAEVPRVSGLAPGWRRYRGLHLVWNSGSAQMRKSLLVVEKTDGTIAVGPRFGSNADILCFSSPEPVGGGFEVRGDELVGTQKWMTPRAKDNGPEGPLEEDGGTFEEEATRCTVSPLACSAPALVVRRTIDQAELQRLRRPFAP